MTPVSSPPDADQSGRGPGDRAKQEWGQLLRGYAIIAGTLGLPCAALSIYFREPWIIVGWMQLLLGIPLLLSMMTALWIVTAWPLLLLLAFIFGRNAKGPKDADPDGPGIIVCR
jgi:hypothetical protein